MRVERDDIGDYVLSFAAVVQSLLIVLQQFLISVLLLSDERATLCRIIFSAIPTIVALVYVVHRNLRITLATYFIAATVVVIQCGVFPQNQSLIVDSVFRFLFPILIPIVLAVFSVERLSIFMRTLYYVSWVTFGVAMVFLLMYVGGYGRFLNYSISFSYALLIPALSLYSAKSIKSQIASLLLLLTIVVLGSRGAVLIFVAYCLYDAFVVGRRYTLLVAMLTVVLIPRFVSYLGEVGVTSRTLKLLESGAIVGYDSGRSVIYGDVVDLILEHPLGGVGIFGERALLGHYAHNIILEILVQWGVPIGVVILSLLLYWVVATYANSNDNRRVILILFSMASFIQLFVSSSYLTNLNFALFLGVLLNLRAKIDNPKYE
ncbi:MAG: O-antigen ligase family protein [Rikenellaceae bacterium]